MEIKTTQDIAGEFIKVRDGLEDRHLENPETIKLILDKKWIAIDSLIKYLDKESYGYRENGCNIINVDELREKLRKHR